MKKTFVYLFSVVSLLAGIFFIGIFGYTFLSNYYPFSLQKEKTTVIHKESEIGLSFFPKYYITVLDEAESSISSHRVSKKAMLSTHIGETISGYQNKGQFFTSKQIILDIVYLIIFCFIGVTLFFLGILIFVRNTSLMHKIRQLNQSIRTRISENMLQSIKYLLFIAALMVIFGGHILHFFQIHFNQHDEVYATIVEVERKPGYGRFNGPTFIFTLNYEWNHESIEARVRVSKEIYDLYGEGTTLKILYQKKNPYYVFMPYEINSKVKGIIQQE